MISPWGPDSGTLFVWEKSLPVIWFSVLGAFDSENQIFREASLALCSSTESECAKELQTS